MMNKRKVLTISGIALAAAALIGGAGWFFAGRSSTTPVYVYDFSMLGMTDFWGDNHESYGPVRTDRIQNVVLTETQSDIKIVAKQGASVKKGDLLMTYDTTLSDLELQKKRLEIDKLGLQLEEEYIALQEICAMQPKADPDDRVSNISHFSEKLEKSYKLSSKKQYDGSKKNLPIICWLRTDTPIDNGVLEAVRKRAEKLQTANLPKNSSKKVSVTSYYVIFKQTKGNTSKGTLLTWQGVKVNTENNTLSFFNASNIPDYTLTVSAPIPEENAEETGGYTAAQLAQMRADQKKAVLETEYDMRMAESDYRIMEKEMADGNVYAQFDGTVVSVLSEKEAKERDVPVIKVSGGGGFYIDASIGELDREQITIGQEVTVTQFRNGATCSGTVYSVGDTPVSSFSYSGMSNPNASSYPLTIFVDGSADLQADDYVTVQYTTSSNGSGIYLENPYIRTENGESYVYIQGSDGRLEKRTVTTGKHLWGSYTEILSGISKKDKLAFPYGKNVRPGAPTQQGDYSTLYN